MCFLNKKSQVSGKGAAALVAIIMGLIILYILFLPPSEREKLLFNATKNVTEEGVIEENVTLLLEHPGRLEYLAAKEYEKSIPSLSLYVKTESTIVKSLESIIVKNSWLGKQSYNLSFRIPDVEHTTNVILSFNAEKRKGILRLILNGKTIYEKEITEANVAVNIPKEYLQENNSLIFEVSSVGIRFWSSNIYELSSIKLVADITDVSKQYSSATFIISSSEINNLESSILRFYVDCENRLDLNKLNISINNHIIYSQIPICGDFVQLPFATEILSSGENKIEFKTEFNKPTTAYYALDRILIKLKLKEPSYPVYYFNLKKSQFDDIVSGKKKITMKLTFIDDVTTKKADLYVNGIISHIDTKEFDWTKDISDFVREGNNAIKIVPRITFDSSELTVILEQK